ncbi:MAG: mechanosensitive ion channel family protein [Cytophagales bacterium]|nr:mechanosensitive ion channel family protein [Cytophagales bacterium]
MKISLDVWYMEYIVVPIAILLIAFGSTRVLRFFLDRSVKAASETLKVDPTRYNFIKNALSFVIYVSAIIIIFYSIPTLKDYGLTLFASAGVLAAIVGFASQSAFSNIISGIFIVIFKPFRVGDIVNVGNLHTGEIEDITLRHTVIRNFENRRVVIPNTIISNETVINSHLTEEMTCMFIEMGISYDSDIDLAMKIMQEEAMQHPNFTDRRTEEDQQNGDPAVNVRLVSFGDSSVNLRAWVWAANPSDGFVMRCDLYKSIKERFDQEGVEIPFPYRTIVYKEKDDPV